EHGGRAIYVDDHTQPVREELFELLEAVLPRCTGLLALTFEGDGHPRRIAERTLRRLRGLLDAHLRPAKEAPAQQRRAVAEAVELGGPAMSVLERTHGREPEAEDPEGQRLEAKVRLWVLAEQLDRTHPLTRLLLCPDEEGLSAFLRSDELHACFAEAGGSVAR